MVFDSDCTGVGAVVCAGNVWSCPFVSFGGVFWDEGGAYDAYTGEDVFRFLMLM